LQKEKETNFLLQRLNSLPRVLRSWLVLAQQCCSKRSRWTVSFGSGSTTSPTNWISSC